MINPLPVNFIYNIFKYPLEFTFSGGFFIIAPENLSIKEKHYIIISNYAHGIKYNADQFICLSPLTL